MKQRAFVRYSKQGKIVPGSLILTSGSYPQGSATWAEVSVDLCCTTPDVVFTFDTTGTTDFEAAVVTINCDEEAIITIETAAEAAATLEDILAILVANYAGFGTWSIADDDVTLQLTMTAALAEALCSGTITIAVDVA